MAPAANPTRTKNEQMRGSERDAIVDSAENVRLFKSAVFVPLLRPTHDHLVLKVVGGLFIGLRSCISRVGLNTGSALPGVRAPQGVPQDGPVGVFLHEPFPAPCQFIDGLWTRFLDADCLKEQGPPDCQVAFFSLHGVVRGGSWIPCFSRLPGARDHGHGLFHRGACVVHAGGLKKRWTVWEGKGLRVRRFAAIF